MTMLLNTFILILTLSFSTLFAQEVTDIAFPISGDTGKTDSVQIPAGMIPTAMWSNTLTGGTIVGFNLSVDGGTTFLGVGETGIDTTAWTIPLDLDADLIIPLTPIKAFIMKGTYKHEEFTTWLQLTSTLAQTTGTTIIWVRFIPYTGRN